jgi:hypothetical protein
MAQPIAIISVSNFWRLNGIVFVLPLFLSLTVIKYMECYSGTLHMDEKERLAIADRVQKRIQRQHPDFPFICKRDEIEKELRKSGKIIIDIERDILTFRDTAEFVRTEARCRETLGQGACISQEGPLCAYSF